MTGNPMVTLNRAVAAAMVDGPERRTRAARRSRRAARRPPPARTRCARHLLELAGDTGAAVVEFRAAAARTTNLREQQYLLTQAARLSSVRDG